MTTTMTRHDDTLYRIQRNGACRTGRVNMDAEYFARPTPAQSTVCANCPMLIACGDYALTNDGESLWSDVWGGMTPMQRREIIESRNKAICPACESDAIIVYAHTEVCTGCGASWSI